MPNIKAPVGKRTAAAAPIHGLATNITNTIVGAKTKIKGTINIASSTHTDPFSRVEAKLPITIVILPKDDSTTEITRNRAQKAGKGNTDGESPQAQRIFKGNGVVTNIAVKVDFI